MNKSIEIIIFSILSLALFYTVPVFASEIRLDSHKLEINLGEQFLMDVLVHGEEPLNAIEGRLAYPRDKLSVVDIRDGNSVLNLWVEKPRIETPGLIIFSGITPGGFSGANNKILSVVFEAKSTGMASITLHGVRALQNDGLGSQATIAIHNTKISIKEGYNSASEEILTDNEPPEDFNPVIESNPDIFDGKYFLVFATEDKISGIARYEAREGELGWFTTVESPYLLKHQSLDKKIFVKAVDNRGNERMAKVAPLNPPAWYENYINLIIIILGVITVVLAKRKIWTKKSAKY